MSYDDNNIKSRNSQIYFDSLHKERKKRDTNKKMINFLNRGSKNENKIDSKISFQRRKKKQMTIGPLSSTLESTVASSKHQIDDENSSLSSEKITIKSKKLLQPKDEDMKFLFDIFYKNNQINLRQTTKTAYIRRKTNENLDYYYNTKIYDLNAIKKYLIKIQKKYNVNKNIMLYQNFHQNKTSVNILDSYQLQKLEDLIARYSLIIFIFLRSGKINEAKEIFLVMLKENMNNINNVEKIICSKYMVINRRINIFKDIPKFTYELAKIYSFIIKYSQLFNMTNYRNKYMGKYYQIQLLNYNFFMLKGNIRGFSAETRNQIRYWFTYCLHNTTYYTINHYFPFQIPIICNYNILSLYNNFEENSLTESEKSLLIKSSYNQGLLYYINDQKDEALSTLNRGKEKIKSFSDDYIGQNNSIKNKKSQQNIFKKPKKEDIIEINSPKKIKKKSTINPFKLKFDKNRNGEKGKSIKSLYSKNSEGNIGKINNIKDLTLNSFDFKSKKSKDLCSTPKNKFDELKSKIYKNFKKDKITISDIELLLNFGKEKGLLNEEPTTGSKGLDFLFKYKESFSNIKKKLNISKGFRGSHIDFHTTMKIKDFFIPERFKNPLLRKIELLMSIIELDKNNYEAAYEHVLNVLYIVLLLKLSGNTNYDKDFFNRQKIEINEYFKIIEDLYDKDLKMRQQLLDRSSSTSIMNIYDRKSQINISPLNSLNLNMSSSYNNLNNSINNSCSIIFENKAAENNFYKNYSSIFNKDNNDINYIQNDNNYNYKNDKDTKIIKEFEKFFIFLNNLSVYQIKILNDTQPENEKRNYLPLMFSDQFKDCLTRIQRIEFDNLQTMALSRFTILKDPNRWIVPNNLNYILIEKSRSVPKNKRKSFHITFDRYNYFDETFMKTKEYKNYLEIVNSEKATPEIKEFLRKNKNYVIKIIKRSSELEIKNIINYPYIIIDIIKKYKRKIKKIKKSEKEKKDEDEQAKRPQTITHSFARQKIIKDNYNINKNRGSDFNKSRIKGKKNNSVCGEYYPNKRYGNNITNQNLINKCNLKTFENKIYLKKESDINNNDNNLNETFEDYLLSPELSFFNDE